MPAPKRKELEEKYAELAKKHGLPSLEEFEEEFGVKLREPIVPEMMSAVYQRLANAARHMEAIINPQGLADWIESDFYIDKEREEVYAVFKILCLVLHEMSLASHFSTKDQIEALKKTLKEYDEDLKQKVISFLQKQVEMWRKETEKAGMPRHGRVAYHG